MTTNNFWRQVVNAFLHHGPAYELPTTAEHDAKARIAAALTECDTIESELHGQHDEDADDMREAVRRIRAALAEKATR